MVQTGGAEYKGPSRAKVREIALSHLDLAIERHGAHHVIEMLADMAPRVGNDTPRLAEFCGWYGRLAGRVRSEIEAGNLVASGTNGGGEKAGGSTPSQQQLHQVDTLLGLVMDGAGRLCEAADALGVVIEAGAGMTGEDVRRARGVRVGGN